MTVLAIRLELGGPTWVRAYKGDLFNLPDSNPNYMPTACTRRMATDFNYASLPASGAKAD